MSFTHKTKQAIVRTVILCGVLLTVAGGTRTLLSQSFGNNGQLTTDETITINAGDVFEIMTASDDPSAQSVWVLTKEKQFIEASRENVFRTRQIMPGEYVLDVSVTEPLLGNQERRLFLLKILPRTPVDPSQLLPQGGDLVTTFPPAVQGTVTLPENLHVLTLTPNQADTVHFGLLLDSTLTQAAPDNMNTYSYNEASPLHVWFVTPRDRTMEIAIQHKDGTVVRSPLTLTIGEPASIVSSQQIIATAKDDGTVRFSLEQPILTGQPAFALWDFGDGAWSMVNSPRHQYDKNGTYIVHVWVRNLQTGEVTADSQTAITLTGIPEHTGTGGVITSSSSSVSSSSSSTGGTVTPAGPGIMSRIFSTFSSPFIKLVLEVLGVIILLGLLVLVIMRLLRKSGLDSTLESAEAVLLKKEAAIKSVIDAPAVPLQMKRSAKTEDVPAPVSEVVSEKKEDIAPPAEPVIDESQAPAWLKKGLDVKPTPVAEPIIEDAVITEPVVEELPPEPEPVPEPLPEPEAPTPVPEAPSAPVVTVPEPTPSPVQEQEVPESLPTDATVEPVTLIVEPELSPMEPAPVATEVSAPVATTAPLTPAQDKEARDRERRRLKRQRYRANLKKREEEKKGSGGITAVTKTAEGADDAPKEELPEQVAPAPAVTPIEEPKMPEPVVTPALLIIEEPKAPEQIAAPEPELALPPENFQEELPAASPAHELPAAEPAYELPAAEPSHELPPAQPSSELPAPNHVKEQSELEVPRGGEAALRGSADAPTRHSPNPNPTSNPIADEDVQFIIRAEGISPDENSPMQQK